MSPQGSLTRLNPTNASAKAAELSPLSSQDSREERRSRRLIKREAASLGLEMSVSKRLVPHEDCEAWRPVDYRGTFTRPLAYFGDFEVKPETRELPWICDNTSGAVHPDMCTISMLFNEDLTLPKAAESFVEQSSALREEASWERAKAVFYSFYPEDLKKQVFETLSGLSPRDASRIIAKKTSRFENEIVLISRPKYVASWEESDSESESESYAEPESCSQRDAVKLNKELKKITFSYMSQIASALEEFKTAAAPLFKHRSFEINPTTHTSRVMEQSKQWADEMEAYQEAARKCIQARLLFHHLHHAVARYEPRTGWIHVKTQLLRPGSEENELLPEELLKIRIHPMFKIRGSIEAQHAAVDKQMAHFEKGLQDIVTGHFINLDFHHNILSCHEYEIRIPYAKIAPASCKTIVKTFLPQKGYNNYAIVSTPQLSPYEKSHHVMKVYIDLKKGKVPLSVNSTFNATAEYKDRYGCCLNCFSRDHVAVGCERPVYAFANPI